jgi:hypothetical protein
MQLFSADAKIFFKYFWFFLPTKIWKNHPKKLHTHGSWDDFFSAALTAQNSPELQFFYLIISARISGEGFSFTNWENINLRWFGQN